MDKKSYLQIRSQNAFPIRYLPLLRHGCENLLLLSLIFLIHHHVSQPFSFFLMSPLFSICMFRSFGLMHDATHGALLPTKKLNDLFGVCSGALCLLPFEQWKESHILHHYWSGNIEKDPVMALVTKFPKFPLRTKMAISFLWKLWFPILSVLQHLVFWILSLKTYVLSPKSLYKTLSLLAPMVFWGAILFLSSSAFIICAVTPSIIMYLVGTEVINLPHHLQLPQLKEEQKYPVWEQYKTARTCLYPPDIASFFVLNFNYHAEHHMFPDVPWYYLPEIQKKILTQIREGYHCDPMFSWILENRNEDVEAMLLKTRDSFVNAIKKSA